jgi:hypothetical protein
MATFGGSGSALRAVASETSFRNPSNPLRSYGNRLADTVCNSTHRYGYYFY